MPTAQNKELIAFGPFCLNPAERLLTKNGERVELRGRAYDLLMALLSRPNELISKSDLLLQVWPGLVVEEGSLRFHMTNLRKALGDGSGGHRYIVNSSGRGYSFVAEISRAPAQDIRVRDAAPFQHANLPIRLPMIDREVEIEQIPARLGAKRFVTIVGAGGVGKTTLAIAVGHRLMETFAGALLFVDFSMVSDPALVGTIVASLLGLSVQSENAAPSIIAYLRDKRILLILDTCEHLVEPVAAFASSIFASAPNVHILATSREALQAEGENVYRLDALAYPPEGVGLTAEAARTFPAVQLFVERARASGAQLHFSDDEAPVVANMCRRLDGVALAIELAARRVETYGVHGTAELLDQRLALSWLGPRSAPPRQRTLHATMDWSFGLLSELERAILRRLAVFVGHFTLDAVITVCGYDVSRKDILNTIDSLVAKSMVVIHPIGAMIRYRLLDTTRAYALDIEMDATEAAGLAERHATYFRRWLEQARSEWETQSTGTERAPYFAGLNNARAALEWCFGQDGNVEVGIGVAAAAAPVFFTMSLLPECLRWSERAVLALDENSRGGSDEMQLQASLGLSLMYTRGHSQAASAALHRSVEIANARGDHLNEMRLLGPLFFYHFRSGEFKICGEHARRSSDIADTLNDPAATALANTLLGISQNISGHLSEAQVALDAALDAASASPSSRRIHFGFDHHNWVRVTRITTLYLQGYPGQASAIISEAFRDVQTIHHPVAFALVINSTATLLWMGDFRAAERHIEWLTSRAQLESFGPYLHVAYAFKGELAICRGQTETGIELLQSRLRQLHSARYELFTVRLQSVLARGLAASGRWAEALSLLDEAERLIDEKGYTCFLPEILRLKGSLLLAMPERSVEDAERFFMRSLELSRSQGARAWELRAATDLAAYWARQGRVENARDLLLPVFEHFTENLDAPDIKAAQAVLATLG